MTCLPPVNIEMPQSFSRIGIVTRTVTRPVVSVIGFGVTTT